MFSLRPADLGPVPAMRRDNGRSTAWQSLRVYAFAMIVITLAAAIAVVFRRLPHANVPLLFLTAVIIIAALWGFWPSIFSGVLGFLALNFFYTAPFYTFKVDDEGDVATLVFFLLTAGLTGRLAGRMRAEMATRQAALNRLTALVEFSRHMAAAATAEDALQALAGRIARALAVPAVILMPSDEDQLERIASAGEDDPAGDFEPRAAQAAWQNARQGEPVQAGDWTCLPLVTTTGPIGMAVLRVSRLDDDQVSLIAGFCDQASIAVERVRLVDTLKEVQLVSETERLRSALLSSVSHDLRTPLASIIGSATSVMEYDRVLRDADRQALLQTVVDEAQRLNRYIQNLLDMTRFGSGPIELRRDWVDLNDLVAGACERLGPVLAHARLSVDIDERVAVICVHGALMEQVLVNLLDNAASFTPDGGIIRIAACMQGDSVVIDVSDRGPGIPEALREKVFHMFFRVAGGDRQRSGTGLGLAICRSVIKAHGGNIEILDAEQESGTLVRIHLPYREGARDAA